MILYFSWRRIQPRFGEFNLGVTVTDGKVGGNQTVVYQTTLSIATAATHWRTIMPQTLHRPATDSWRTQVERRQRLIWDSRPSGPVGDLRGEYAPRLMARVVSLRRDSRRRHTASHAPCHGVSRAVSRRRRLGVWLYTVIWPLLRRSDTLLTVLSGCYRCFDHYSIQVHSTTLCHDCPMIVACCTNACHCVAAAVAIIK